jgi:dipeptidyl aminopeptidase/acylaminoacyl peptidase
VSDADRLLIDPEPKEMADALDAAFAEANASAEPRRMVPWSPRRFGRFEREFRAAAEGKQRWTVRSIGVVGIVRFVAVAWWTDPLGRKHVRIRGRRAQYRLRDRVNLLVRDSNRPPLWLTYPDNLYYRQETGGLRLFAVCRCGASGEPASLGWMGDCCGPCHDRREAGDLPSFPGPMRTVLHAEDEVRTVRFAPDGRTILWQAFAGPASAWEPESDARRVRPRLRERSILLAVSPDGRTAAVGRTDGGIRLWDYRDNKDIGLLRTTRGGGLAFSPDGSLVASLHYDEVRLWGVADRKLKRTISLGPPQNVLGYAGLAFSPDGRTLAVGGARPLVRLIDVAAGVVARPQFGNWDPRVTAVAFTPDGRTIGSASPHVDGALFLWDPSVPTLRRTPVRANDLAISPDGRLAATAGTDGQLRLWEVANLRAIGSFEWHEGPILSVSFSPDGQRLATGGADDRLKLWPLSRLLEK